MVTTKLKESKKVLKSRKRPIQKLTRPSNWQIKNQKRKTEDMQMSQTLWRTRNKKVRITIPILSCTNNFSPKIEKFSKNQPS